MPDFSFREKLMEDPKAMDLLYRYTKAEVSGQGRNAAKAFMEVATNRADADKRSIPELLSGYKGGHAGMDYYPEITHTRAQNPLSQTERDYYDGIAKEVREGSNVANFGTGNASGSVGFAGGPMTAKHGGEKFGIEGWTAQWAKEKGYSGSLPMPTSAADRSEPSEGGAEAAVYGKSGRRQITVSPRPRPDKSLASIEPDWIQEPKPLSAADIEGMPVPRAPDIQIGRLKVPDYG
jgi:hypothetical protein